MSLNIRQFIRARASDLELISIKAVCRLPIHAARVYVLRAWGAEIGHGATIYHGIEVRAARKLRIGARSSIGNGVVLDARGGLDIDADVNISSQVQIWTAQHDWRSDDFAYKAAPVVIGRRAWLSARATVLPGVSIGAAAVVAAGAVVSRDVSAHALVGGVPAKVIAERSPHISYELPSSKQKAWWW